MDLHEKIRTIKLTAVISASTLIKVVLNGFSNARVCQYVYTVETNNQNPRVSSTSKSALRARGVAISARARRTGAQPFVPGSSPSERPGARATIKRQKVLRRRSFRSPPLSSTLLQARSFPIEPQKRSTETRRFGRPPPVLCRANNGERAAQLRSDVLTVFPNTLLRFYGKGERETSELLSRIRLTCGICSASETSRREREREKEESRETVRAASLCLDALSSQKTPYFSVHT